MIILAIDTASSICAVCLTRESEVLAQASEVIGTGHAERLMPMLHQLMHQAKVSFGEIGLVAVSIGPGSFTGVRTGIAAAKGFGQALNIPAIGISTLEAVAFESRKLAGNAPLRAVIDAKRGEVHTQDFGPDGAPDGVPVLLSLEDARGGLGLRTLVGNGAALVDAKAPSIFSDASTASISIFAEIAGLRHVKDTTSLTMTPLYLRGADAKPQSGFAIARTSA